MRRLRFEDSSMNAINVTPIIDVALVLVIILMITAPMLAVPQVDLKLPEARTLTSGEENRVNVTLARDGLQVRVMLNQEPPENSCRPAADPLFRSAAKVYGSGVLGVVLTGMGQDGFRGSEMVRAAGGQVEAG